MRELDPAPAVPVYMLSHSIRRLPRFTWAAILLCLSPGPVWAASDAVPVSTHVAQTKAVIETVTLTGTVVAPRRSRVSTAVPGQVVTLDVNIGDRVEAGTRLLALDDDIATQELESARAAVREARAELADARRRLTDARELAQNETISETEVLSLEAEVSISQAALDRLGAEARRQARHLERHQLTAPFPGVISEKLTEVGEWVTPGTPALELVANDELRIDFQVSQNYYPRLDNNSRIQVTLDALPNRLIETRVEAVVPVSDPETRTFTLRLEPVESVPAMTPGMSASGILRIDTGERGVVIPRDALIRYPDGRITVWVVEERSTGAFRVDERLVQTGLSFDGQVHILSGVDAGMSVITEGNETLRDGQAVRIRQRSGS